MFYEYIIKIVGSHAITEEQEKEENQAKSSQDNLEHNILMQKSNRIIKKWQKVEEIFFEATIYFAPSVLKRVA